MILAPIEVFSFGLTTAGPSLSILKAISNLWLNKAIWSGYPCFEFSLLRLGMLFVTQLLPWCCRSTTSSITLAYSGVGYLRAHRKGDYSLLSSIFKSITYLRISPIEFEQSPSYFLLPNINSWSRWTCLLEQIVYIMHLYFTENRIFSLKNVSIYSFVSSCFLIFLQMWKKQRNSAKLLYFRSLLSSEPGQQILVAQNSWSWEMA